MMRVRLQLVGFEGEGQVLTIDDWCELECRTFQPTESIGPWAWYQVVNRRYSRIIYAGPWAPVLTLLPHA
jgi:hypothetical protein